MVGRYTPRGGPGIQVTDRTRRDVSAVSPSLSRPAFARPRSRGSVRLFRMGCCQSDSSTLSKVPALLCRRSIGNVKDDGPDTKSGISKDAHGLIAALAEKDITEMLAKNDARKLCITSCEDYCKTSFAEKNITVKGSELSPEDNLPGYTCRKGLKLKAPNQDSWFILKVCDSFSLYGVFDGHGNTGHHVSNFVKDTLPKLMIKDQRCDTDDLCPLMWDAFRRTQVLLKVADQTKILKAQTAGTTASVVIHDHKRNKLTVAHVADSTVVLGRYTSTDGMEALTLTQDHKPNLQDERARIERCGGRVVFHGYSNHRVCAKNACYPGLNMSRCIGDLMGHELCGIIAEAEVSEIPIREEDHVLILCSDGVWEFIQPHEAVRIVSSFAPTDAMKAARTMAKVAWSRWIAESGGKAVDDITVILVYLNQMAP